MVRYILQLKAICTCTDCSFPRAGICPGRNNAFESIYRAVGRFCPSNLFRGSGDHFHAFSWMLKGTASQQQSEGTSTGQGQPATTIKVTSSPLLPSFYAHTHLCAQHTGKLLEAPAAGRGRRPTWGLGVISKPLTNYCKDERVKHCLDPHRRSVKEKQS